jgi:hypothetical protein
LRIIVGAIWVVLLLVLAYRFWLQPQISRQIGEQISERIGGVAASGQPGGDGPLDTALPTAIAALPPGELRVTEQQVNDYLATNRNQLEPIETASVRFTSGRAILDLRVYGLDGRISAGLVAQNGRVVATDPQLEGTLSQVITIEELLAPIEARLNEQLAAQGRTFQSVEVVEGAIILQS